MQPKSHGMVQTSNHFICAMPWPLYDYDIYSPPENRRIIQILTA